MIRKIVSILIVGLFVASCTWRDNPLSRNSLAVAESSYGVALSAAVAYRNLPLCKKNQSVTYTNVCAKREIILKLQEADKKVQTALIDLRNFRKNYPQLDPAAYLEVARIAINQFKAVLADNGISNG